MIKKAQNAILEQILLLLNHEGLTDNMLSQASRHAGYPALYYRTVFDTHLDVARAIIEDLDRKMADACLTLPLTTLPVRTRIYEIIKQRLICAAPYKDAYRHLHHFMAQPCHLAAGLRINWNIADSIWRLAGDTATDFNHYTKRSLLLAVYTSTMLYWFQDHSTDHSKTLEFLTRRIQNALAIGTYKKHITGFFTRFSAQG